MLGSWPSPRCRRTAGHRWGSLGLNRPSRGRAGAYPDERDARKPPNRGWGRASAPEGLPGATAPGDNSETRKDPGNHKKGPFPLISSLPDTFLEGPKGSRGR